LWASCASRGFALILQYGSGFRRANRRTSTSPSSPSSAASVKVADPRPERDALIAATASACSLTVVTRNVADVAPMGVAFINPRDDLRM